jgi:PAS domain S-box-containing protein
LTAAPPSIRLRNVALASAITVALVAVEIAFPKLNAASLELVPLLLICRVLGLRLTLVLAAVSAPLLVGLDAVLRHDVSTEAFLLDAGLLVATFVAVVALVEYYRGALVRTAAADVLVARRGGAVARERDVIAIAEAIPQLVWSWHGDGMGGYFNAAWLAYTGLSRATLSAGGIETAVHPDDAAAVRNAWRASSGSGGVFEVEVRLRARDGSYGWFLARATPLFAEDGATIVRWFGTCTDIAAQKRTEAELSRRFAEADRVSVAFQQASLPAALPDVPGLRFDAIYRAGKPEAEVGGDWYDALRLLDGRILLSVGDVSGSGLSAALAMVAVRQAIRGAAQIHADPLAILDAADRTLRNEGSDRLVTAFVGIYDPITARLAYASAGHPAPLVRGPRGEVRELAAPGLPLGLRRKGDSEAADAPLEPGSLLVLYTDGLTEASRDLVEGERRVRDALAASAVIDSATPAAALAHSVLTEGASDDVAILTLGVEAGAPGALRWAFDSGDAAAAAAARREFAGALSAAGARAERVDDAETVFVELLANVVRHAPGPCEVALDRSGPLPVLVVLDRGRGRGLTHVGYLRADVFAESGRGLFIVRSLALDFNAFPRPGGGTNARAVLHAA